MTTCPQLFVFSPQTTPEQVSFAGSETQGRQIPNFDDGFNGWVLEIHTDKGCQANWQVISGALKVNIANVGSDINDARNNPYRVQVKQIITTLKSNTKYCLKFDFKGTIPWFAVTISKNEPDWSTVGIYQTVSVSNTWQLREFIFTTPSNVISNNKLNFQVGSGVGEIFFDNIVLQEALGKEMVETTAISLPIMFELFQNYPNPFNPATRIDYQLPEDGQVKLEIFNTLGQPVDILVDGFQTAGTYSVVWDGKNSPARVYFLILQDGQFKEIKKMSLIK